MSAEDLFDNYLHEKTLKVDKFNKNPSVEEPAVRDPNSRQVHQLKDQANSVHEKANLENISEKAVRS